VGLEGCWIGAQPSVVMTTVAVLALNLISARRNRSLTQESLGQQSGVSMYVVAHIERQAHNPSLLTLAKLCVPLRCTMEALLSGPRQARD
jgi:DNA-binding XRE family transcriptional regulator